MDRIAVITDSVACLPRELAAQYHIHIVPAGNIRFEGKIYRDWLDLDHDDVYRMLENKPKEFFTGSTSPMDFLETFKELSLQANTILYIALSSKFSTLYNMARVAQDMAKKELPGINIEIIDSYTATAAQGFVALATARAAIEGKSLKDVINAAETVKRKVDLFYIIETVRYVYRTGRVPKTVASLGSKLNVRPIITVRNGSAHIEGLVRNKGRGIEHLLELCRQGIKHNLAHIAVLHTDALDEAEKLKQQISREFNCIELWISQFSPLMAYATGRGVIGIAFYGENS